MILVTGSTGKDGSELVKWLREEGTPFRGAFHSPEKAEKGRASGLDTAVLDYARPETLPPALAGVERLFLLTPPGSTRLGARIVEASGLLFTFLRPNGFLQTYFMYGATIKTQPAFYLPDRAARWTLIDVR